MVNDRSVIALSDLSERADSAGNRAEVSDDLLLARFVDQWDESAFRDLVNRHGPTVLGVCQRILRDAHASEDAFQATFLLLVRKAGSVRKRGSVGPWLYGVAQRVALEARGIAARHRMVSLAPEPDGVDDQDGRDQGELYQILHEELGRLPEKYRAPLVLCYIDGLSHDVVAQRLGWPLGTVRGRIARGRDLLGSRLIRRGLAPAAVLFALSLLSETARAVPERLRKATVRAATRVAAGEGAAGGNIPARIANLEERVSMAMRLTSLKWAAAIAFGLVLPVTALAAILPATLAVADDAAKNKAEREKLQGTWMPASAESEGQTKDGGSDHERLKIDGDTLFVMDQAQIAMKATIKLDASKSPMEMDFVFEEGKFAGKTALVIYMWDGENLKFCATEPGTDQRPTAFKTEAGDKRMMMVLKRQNP
jgi:RNA polymerase sigma factor (sigma-70 family)